MQASPYCTPLEGSRLKFRRTEGFQNNVSRRSASAKHLPARPNSPPCYASRRLVSFETQAVTEGSEENIKAISNLDVGEAVVNPSFRATPWRAEKRENSNRSGVRIVFVSESNICRSPLAAGLLQQLLKDNSLEGEVEIASRATRDYAVGDTAHPSAVIAAEGLGVELAPHLASRFDYTNDTVHFDMILVMDKFTAADVMREISVFDTINKDGKYAQKVRRLGEFHLTLREGTGTDGQDIEDPLYGNTGGTVEMEAVEKVAIVIKEACEGLVSFLRQLRDCNKEASLYDLVRAEMNSMKELDWLAPPMLSRR